MANRILLTVSLPPRMTMGLRHEAFRTERGLDVVVTERLQHGLELLSATGLDLGAVHRQNSHWDMLSCLLSHELYEELRHRAWGVRVDRSEFAAYLFSLSHAQRPLHAAADLY